MIGMSERGYIEIRIGDVAKMRGVKSAAELGRRTNLSRESARLLMKARTLDDLSRIGIDTLEKLCHGLKTSPGQLLNYHPSGLRPSGVHDDPASP